MAERRAWPAELERFKEIVSQFKEKELDEIGFWRLQVAARDAILSVDVSSGVSSEAALKKICEVVRLLFGGTTSSIILEDGDGWAVAAADGEGSEKITGAPLDPNGASISSKVIKNKTPYYFSDINEHKGISKNNDPQRYSNSTFCSFPLLSPEKDVLGVVNVAGMDRAHPIFKTERLSMEGALDTIAVKVTKLKKSQELILAHKDIEIMKEAETVRERLLYMTVHDLKNPLTLISANLAHLEHVEMDDAAKEIVKLSKFGGDRILDMVQSILDSYKIESGRMELNKTRFDLVSLAKSIIREFEVAALADSVGVSCESPEEVWVEADESIIRRVFSNLLDNALRYSPIKGKIIIRIAQAEDTVSFSVKDEGEGVELADQEKIFDAFERAKSSLRSGASSNYGLGLAFCHMAIKAHGGCIGLESAPGAGAKFMVSLPKTASS